MQTPYDEEDVEADQIYESVDEFMDGRHKRRREQQMLDAQKNKKNFFKISNKKISILNFKEKNIYCK